MHARRRTILALFQVFSWLFLCSAQPSFALDNRYADSLRHSLHTKQPDTLRIKTLLHLSSVYEADSLAKSFYYASEALFLSEKKEWQKGISAAELRVAICYIEVWELQEAIKHLHRSIKSARIVGDKHTERNCWQYLVHCYDHLGAHQKAVDCQGHLLKMVMQTGDTAAICRHMSTYATVMYSAGHQAEGIDWLKKGIIMAENHLHGDNQIDVTAELSNTLANIYVNQYKTDSAFYMLHKAMPLAMAINDTPNIAYIASTFCDAYFYSNKLDSAEYYAHKTIAMAEQLNDLPLQKGYHVTLSRLYEKKNQSAKALRYYKSADSLGKLITDSEKTLEQSMQLSRVAIQQQLKHRQQEKRNLESVNAGQRKALTITFIILIALAIIAILIFRNLKVKENKNKIIKGQAEDLQQQNEQIDAALRDKEILLQEMHHRVKNNLQLINGLLELQITKLSDKNSADALIAAQQRIYSMAMVHSKLYHNSADASVEVHEFATDLFQSLYSALNEAERNVRLEDDISVNYLPLNMLIPLGLILNELITNSFKHAFRITDTGTIILSLHQENEIIVLTYRDSGGGIAAARFEENTETLGIYLITRLTRQLKGEMAYSNEFGYKFTFPI